MDHFCINGLLYSPMPGLSLRTLKANDQCRHLVITEQLLTPSFISVLSHWTDDVSDGLLHDYDSACYMVLWLSLLLY